MVKTPEKGTVGGIIGVALIGIAAWLLLRKKEEEPEKKPKGVPIPEENVRKTRPAEVASVKVQPRGGQPVRIRSTQEGVDFVNRNFGRLEEQGRTIAKLEEGFRVKVEGVEGTFGSGTVSEIRDAQNPDRKKNVFLGVRTPEKNRSVLTAFQQATADRLGLSAAEFREMRGIV